MFELETENRHALHSGSPFSVDYVTAGTASASLPDPGHLLASVQFSAQTAASQPATDSIVINAPSLGAHDTEIWYSAQPVTSGNEHDIAFCHNDDVLFGCLHIDENDSLQLEEATRHAYEVLYAFTTESGFAYPLRIWNWFPAINRVDDQLERYRSFCRGRHHALTSIDTKRLPAASAIGTHNGGLCIYFIAAHEPGIQVENPRQVSAFRYPARYSPKSPSFSRAMVKRWGHVSHLYVSGTASIVGHESRHSDTLAQLDESLDNLDAVISHADHLHGIGIQQANQLSRLKCYIRHADEQAIIQKHLVARLGDRLPVLMLAGDICRTDLRLEIEGVYTGHE